jgi:hypothetical protein
MLINLRNVLRLTAASMLAISVSSWSLPSIAIASQAASYLPRSAPVSINIPSIHVSSGFMSVGLDKGGKLQVPQTGKIAAWYTGAPTPGEFGPAIIVAHVDMNGQPGIFFHLKDLKAGSLIKIHRQDDTNVSFKVLSVKSYLKNQFPTETVYGNITYAGLRLVTCGGKFDSKIGHYLSNVVVFAAMIK